MRFGEIPHAMRERAQWMLTDNRKAPLAYDWAEERIYAGSKTRKDQYLSFDVACDLAEQHGLWIGYCSQADDPFSIIDLDWKPERVYDVDADELKRGLYEQACESTYVETSMSGLGCHIVVNGKLAHDFNAQNAGIECYGNLGFVVMTGMRVSASSHVTDQQSWLQWLAQRYRRDVDDAQMQQMGAIDWNTINNPSIDDVALDDTLIANMSSWRNAARLEHYFYGRDLRPDGGGGSEGDMSLLQAFMTFTRSSDKASAAMRMFLKTPRAKLRQPYKEATSDWAQYLQRTLVSARMAVARDEQRAKDYDFAEGSRKMLEEYQAQIASAKAPEAPDPIQPNSMQAPINGVAAPFTGFNWLSKSDLEKLPALQWAVKGLFPVGGIGAVYGESGSGKSLVVMDMIAAIAEGRRWFGLRTKQMPVSVFALEGEGGLKGRVRAWESVHNGQYPESVKFWDSAQNGSFALRDGDQRRDDHKNRLIQLCADLKANGRAGGVVVIDTLNQASDGADENSSRDMGELLRAMKFIQRETGSLVLIVHHSTKSKENQSMRGHSSLYGAMDGIMEVVRDVWSNGETEKNENDPEAKLIPGRRAWIAKKVKDGRDGYTKFLDMHEVQIGMDEDGPITSVAIKHVEESVLDEQTGVVTPINVGSLTKPKLSVVQGGYGRSRSGRGNQEAPTWPKESYQQATGTDGASDPTRSERSEKVVSRGRPKGGGAQQRRIVDAIKAACQANGGSVSYEKAQMAIDALSPSNAHQVIKNMTKAFEKLLADGEVLEVEGNSVRLKAS